MRRSAAFTHDRLALCLPQVRLLSSSCTWRATASTSTTNAPNAPNVNKSYKTSSFGTKLFKATVVVGAAAGTGLVMKYYVDHGKLPTSREEQQALFEHVRAQMRNCAREFGAKVTNQVAATKRLAWEQFTGVKSYDNTMPIDAKTRIPADDSLTTPEPTTGKEAFLTTNTTDANSEALLTTADESNLGSSLSSTEDIIITPVAQELAPSEKSSQKENIPQNTTTATASSSSSLVRSPPQRRQRQSRPIITFISPTCRRHIVRVYQLLIGSVGAAAVGYVVSSLFLAGPALPIYAPLVAVLGGVGVMSLMSLLAPSVRQHSYAITARRMIFYWMSFAEGLAIAPMAQALAIPVSVVASAFVVAAAVLIGFAAVALYSGQGFDELNYTSAGVTAYNDASDPKKVETNKRSRTFAPRLLKASTLDIEGALYGNAFALASLTALNIMLPDLFAQSSLLHFGAALFSVVIAVDTDTLVSRFDRKLIASRLSRLQSSSPSSSVQATSNKILSDPLRKDNVVKSSSFSTLLIEDDGVGLSTDVLNDTMFFFCDALNVAVRLGEMLIETAWDSERTTSRQQAVAG